MSSDELESLRRELEEERARGEELNTKLRDANLRIGRQENTLNRLNMYKEQHQKLIAANNSLIKQVQVLEKKVNQAEIDSLRGQLDSALKLCSDKDAIIDKLRDVISLYESGEKSQSSSVTTYLTGPTGIHCNLLEDGNYRVYFSPGRRTVRFVSDESGKVGCLDHEVTLPAIAPFSGFVKIRVLDAERWGDEVVVAL